MEKQKQVIGWREYIDLPEWGIKKLKAKIDTGAKSSSLHVEDIQVLPNNKISFYVVLNKNKRRKKIIATPVRKGKVKSSIGVRTQRWYVKTKVRMGTKLRDMYINLTGREEMNFRLLIGRTALEDDFLVDVAHGYLLEKNVSAEKVKTTKSVKRKYKKGKK